jgi:hypothetical protein
VRAHRRAARQLDAALMARRTFAILDRTRTGLAERSA